MYKGGSQIHAIRRLVKVKPKVKPVKKEDPTKPKTISYREFAEEIKRDLPVLFREYPNGLYVQNLKEYYGESHHRIFHAIDVLKREGVLETKMAPDKTYYIVHPDFPQPPLVELTPLQRKVIYLFMDTCKRAETTAIKTDYSQLTRMTKSSICGLKACVQRLNELDYLRIAADSQVGQKETLVLTVGSNLEKVFADHHLDS